MQKNDIGGFSDSELYIDGPMVEMNMENELASLSWVDSVQKELSSTSSEGGANEFGRFRGSTSSEGRANEFGRFGGSTSSEGGANESKIINEKIIGVDDIINLKCNEICDVTVLKYQTIIIDDIKKALKSSNKNYDDILNKLNWLLYASKYLSDELGLQLFCHKDATKHNIIQRSSYKFCTYNFECQYNYNIKKHCGCYAQHYVHNLVYADIEISKKYLEFIIQNNLTLQENIDELRKTINTISFVIGHMHDELQNAAKYNFFNMENYHMERTPKKKRHSC